MSPSLIDLLTTPLITVVLCTIIRNNSPVPLRGTGESSIDQIYIISLKSGRDNPSTRLPTLINSSKEIKLRSRRCADTTQLLPAHLMPKR